MVRKASRKPGRASVAVTPTSRSSPRSAASPSSGQRRSSSSRVTELQNTTRRASLLYQVYDPSAPSSQSPTAPSPSHAAVVAAAAVLANPTGQPLPPPLPCAASPHHPHGKTSASAGASGQRSSLLSGGGAAAAAARRKKSGNAAPGSAGAGEDTQSTSNPLQKKRSSAATATATNTNTTTSVTAANGSSSAASPPSPSPQPQSTRSGYDDTVLPKPYAKGGSYANENPRLIVSEPLPATGSSSSAPSASPSSATLRGGGVATGTKRYDDVGYGKSSSRSLPHDVSQISTESGASSSASGRPRALSLPRTREGVVDVLPRLRPMRESPGESLRPSPPPPPPPSSSAGGGPSTPKKSTTDTHAESGLHELREVLSAPPNAFTELTTSTSPQQATRRNRERSGPAYDTNAVPTRGGHNAHGNKNGGDASSDSDQLDAVSDGAVREAARNGGFMRSVKVKNPIAPAPHRPRQLGTNKNNNNNSQDNDDDDGIWGDPEREDGQRDAGHAFGNTQLLSSLRHTMNGNGAPSTPSSAAGAPANPLHTPQQPRQPAVPPVNRPHPSPPPAPACADGPPSYKFNVVLSSGKTATTPISLVAGSGCVQGMRPTMEDAHFMQLNATHVRGQPVSLMAVLDGHCGRRVADLGAKWLPHYVLNHAALGENNALALVESILQTDREIFHILQAKKLELEQQRKSGRASGRRRRDVYEEMFDETSGANGGSTLIVAAVCGRMLYVACLGDARAVLYDGQTTIAMSEDHKPGNADESRRIAKCGGFVQFGRVCGILAVSRALGDFEFKFQPNSTGGDEDGLLTDFPFGAQRGGEAAATAAAAATPSSQPASQNNRRFISNRDLMVSNVADVRQLNLTDASAFLLLACDGLWDVLSNEEATEFVRDFLSYTPDVCDPRILSGEKPRPSPEVIKRVLNNCCQKLTEFAVDRGSMDNVSAMVLFFHDVVDTVARFNGRQTSARSDVPSRNSSSVMSGASSRNSRGRQSRSSVQPSSSAAFELTNNNLKVRNGRIVARR